MWISITGYCCWLKFNVDRSQKINFINVKETEFCIFFFAVFKFMTTWYSRWYCRCFCQIFVFEIIYLKKKIQKCLKTTLPDKKYDHYCTNKQKQHRKTHWDCYKAWWTIWKKPNNKHGRMWVVFFQIF